MHNASKSIGPVRGDHGVTMGDLPDSAMVTRISNDCQWLTRRGDLVTLEYWENTVGGTRRQHRTCAVPPNQYIGNLGHPRSPLGPKIAQPIVVKGVNGVTIPCAAWSPLQGRVSPKLTSEAIMQSNRLRALQPFAQVNRSFEGLRERHAKLNRDFHSVRSLVDHNRAVERSGARAEWRNVDDGRLQPVHRIAAINRLIGRKIKVHADSLSMLISRISMNEIKLECIKRVK